MAEIAQHHGEVNGIEFAWLEAGPPDGPLALCLHGFPDTPEGWRPLLHALADQGHHAIAPWARGYAPTAVPADGLSPIGAWVADAIAFHDRFGAGQPGVIVGHDWGAITTYGAASMEADRWRAVVTASVPPTAVMATRLLDYAQVRAFWYQYVFLQPTAELIVANNDLAFIAGLWADWSPGYDATAVLPAVKAALAPGPNLTAALSTYRATYDFSLQGEWINHAAAMLSPHPQRTLYLHGDADGCVPDLDLDQVLAVLSAGSRTELIEGAGHFLQYERPDAVTSAVLAFIDG